MTHFKLEQLLSGALLATGVAAAQETPATPAQANDALGRLPLAFVRNDGQWETAARYVVRHRGQIARFEPDAIVLQLTRTEEEQTLRTLLRLGFEGASPQATVEGVAQQHCRYNYFLGDDPQKWRADVPAFSEVVYRRLQPGVDVHVRDNAGCLEYDLVLAPGADLAKVVIRVGGAKSVELGADGVLTIETELGTVRQSLPLTWLESASGEREAVECRYRRIDDERFGFEVAARDASRTLVIDPHLDWSTYLGGSLTDVAYDCVNEGGGIIDVSGSTWSPDFPKKKGFSGSLTGTSDAFCARFDTTKAGAYQLTWCTYYGGLGNEWGFSVHAGPTGLIDLAGRTSSPKVPTTANAFSRSSAGGDDGFIARFDLTQRGVSQLVWGTMIGGGADDSCFFGRNPESPGGIVTLAVNTNSKDFPTTPNAFDTTFNGGTWDTGFAQLDPGQTGAAQLVYATFFGGSGNDNINAIAVTDAGIVVFGGWTESNNLPTTAGAYSPTYVGGSDDAFMVEIDPSDPVPVNQLKYSTYFGGTADEGANDLVVDAAGRIGFTGSVGSANLPTTPGAYDMSFNGGGYDACLTILDPSQSGASQLVYSTYLGGANGYDYGYRVYLDRGGEYVVVVNTASNDFPTTAGAYQAALGGSEDAAIAKLRPDGNGAADLTYSTYLGGTGIDYPLLGGGLDEHDFPLIVGETQSSDFPIHDEYQSANAGAYDAFITRLALASWFNYGTGLAGLNGIPTFTSQSNPVIGGSLTLDLGNSSGAATSALVLVGLSDANVPVAGGTLLVNAFLFVPLPLPVAGLPMSGSLPNDPLLTGVSVYLQALELDAAAVHGIAFTPGLRLILGY